ncbi:hypothetical protein ACA910_015715 [Epithemia clementina (nom. ined.)]
MGVVPASPHGKEPEWPPSTSLRSITDFSSLVFTSPRQGPTTVGLEHRLLPSGNPYCNDKLEKQRAAIIEQEVRRTMARNYLMAAHHLNHGAVFSCVPPQDGLPSQYRMMLASRNLPTHFLLKGQNGNGRSASYPHQQTLPYPASSPHLSPHQASIAQLQVPIARGCAIINASAQWHRKQELVTPPPVPQFCSSHLAICKTGLSAPISASNDKVAVDSGSESEKSVDALHRCKQSFPEKIYFMLEETERECQDNIVSFVADGTAFLIHEPREFESKIMPLFFSSNRMASFQRQLNIYGFVRINEGKWRGAYQHPFFVQDKKVLLSTIKRRTTALKKKAKAAPCA